jgi:hypothetical protein
VGRLEAAAGRMVAIVVADHDRFRRHVSRDGSLRA